MYQLENQEKYHLVSLNLATGKIIDKVLNKKEYRKKQREIITNYLKKKGISQPTDAAVTIYLDPRYGEKIGYGGLTTFAEELREHLENLNSRASVPYKNVLTALDDYIEVSKNLSRDDHMIMLRGIENLARIYIDGNHNADRISEMQNVTEKIHETIEAMQDLYNLGFMGDKKGAVLRNSEPVARTLRRSMRNRPFDADTFALWEIAKEYDNYTEQDVKEVRNSAAVRFMQEILHDVPVRDEKMLELMYKTAKAGLEMASGYNGDPNLEQNAGNRDMAFRRAAGAIKNYTRTGNTAFDEALKFRMFNMLKAAAHSEEKNPYIKNRNANFQNAVEQNRTFEDNRNFLAGKGESELKQFAEKNRNMTTANTDYQSQFSQALFGTGIEVMENVSKELGLVGERNVPITYFIALLVEKGFTLEEAIDPGKRQEERRTLGEEFRADLHKAKESRTYNKAFLNRCVANHAEEMFKFAESGAEKLSKGEIEAGEFGKAAHSLLDGLFDVICQKLTREERLEAFKKGDEAPEETEKRVDDIYHRADHACAQFKRTNTDIWLQSDKFYKGLNSFAIISDTELKSHLTDIFCKQQFASQVDQVEAAFGEHQKASDLFIKNFSAFVNQFFNQFMDDVGIWEQYAMFFETGKARIAFDTEYIKAHADDLINGGGEKCLQVYLKDDDGVEHRLSQQLLSTGTADSPKEKAFLKTFKQQLSMHAAAEKKKVAAERNQRQKTAVTNLPESLSAYRQMFLAFPEEMQLVSDALQNFCDQTKKSCGKEVNPFDYIVIGSATASELLEKEAGRLNINLDSMKSDRQLMMLSGICVSALKNGKRVSCFSRKDTSFPNLEEELVTTRLHLPTNLYFTKKDQNVFADLWKKVKAFFIGGKNAEAEEAIHERKAEKVKAAYRKMLGARFMQHHAGAAENVQEVRKELGETSKAFDDLDEMNTIEAKKGFQFQNGLNISRNTAILAIAYAMKDGIKGRYTTQVGPMALSTREHIFEKAAKEYRRLQKTWNNDFTDVEAQMRNYLVKGIRNMYLEGQRTATNDAGMDVKQYAAKYAAFYKAQCELLNFVKKAKLMSFGAEEKVCTERDLAAINYLWTSSHIEHVIENTKIDENLEAAGHYLGKYIYFANNVKDNPADNSLTFKELLSENDKAAKFSKFVKEAKNLKFPDNMTKIPNYQKLMRSQRRNFFTHLEDTITTSEKEIMKQTLKYQQQKKEEAFQKLNNILTKNKENELYQQKGKFFYTIR